VSIVRDYISFAKATQKLLQPVLAPDGYVREKGVFARRRSHWVDVIGLQQSSFESGAFCVNLGVHIPSLGAWWQLENYELSSLVVAARLSKEGYGGHEEWFPGATAADLTSSITRVAEYLPKAEAWFLSLATVSDIATQYARQHGLSKPEKITRLNVLSGINFAFLLAETGNRVQALAWLEQVQRLSHVEGKSKHAALLPTQATAVQNALSKLAP
jgi:Domain of unknown function (DUF4304)